MSKEDVSTCSCRESLVLNTRILRLTWCGSGEPERLDVDIILEGSENSKSLTLIHQPTISRSAGIIMMITACG